MSRCAECGAEIPINFALCLPCTTDTRREQATEILTEIHKVMLRERGINVF